MKVKELIDQLSRMDPNKEFDICVVSAGWDCG